MNSYTSKGPFIVMRRRRRLEVDLTAGCDYGCLETAAGNLPTDSAHSMQSVPLLAHCWRSRIPERRLYIRCLPLFCQHSSSRLCRGDACVTTLNNTNHCRSTSEPYANCGATHCDCASPASRATERSAFSGLAKVSCERDVNRATKSTSAHKRKEEDHEETSIASSLPPTRF